MCWPFRILFGAFMCMLSFYVQFIANASILRGLRFRLAQILPPAFIAHS